MTIKRVGIVGSGIMGSGIAEVAAKAGFEVVLRSRAQSTADAMVAGLEKSLAKQVERGKLEADERDAVLGRVRAVADLGELAECDLVLESIVEDLAAKKHLFTELDRICPDHTILATNTSTLPVVEMAMETGRPDKVCGIHFFNPAPMMALVEVVRAITSSDETIADATAFADHLRQERGAGEGPGRLHRERAAVPVPQQRGEAVRRRRRDPRRHRRRDEGRLQLPDGSARAARPRRPRHEPRDPRGALRGVQGPELRAGPVLRRMVSAERLGRKTRRRLLRLPQAVARPSRMAVGAEIRENGAMAERDRPWLIRTYSGHSSARASNELYRTNLAKGQTGLSVAFDLPTQTGYDPDDPLARGEVGKVGVPVPHLGEMRTLFDGIPLDEMNTSMTINATAMWLLGMYLALADEQGVPHASSRARRRTTS